jgi:hypothetical protein
VGKEREERRWIELQPSHQRLTGQTVRASQIEQVDPAMARIRWITRSGSIQASQTIISSARPLGACTMIRHPFG